MTRLFLSLVFCATLSGCADFPNLDGAISDRALAADYPRLQPFSNLYGVADPEGARDAMTEANDLAARVARLKARAAALKGPILTRSQRTNLENAVERHVQ